MRANDVRSSAPTRHGAYLCLSGPEGALRAAKGAAVPALAAGLGLQNEFEAGGEGGPATVAYLRRVGATPGQIDDPGLLGASAVVHVAAETKGPVAAFAAGLSALLGPEIGVRALGGEVRPMVYTGQAMHNFAYARRVLQGPAAAMPNAFLLPMSKTAAWWQKDWMERHTHFLPRYDDAGRMLSRGHVLSAAAGVACLVRRTYKAEAEPAPDGAYDFVNYFECADGDVGAFHEVCGALRDASQNPEWAFVREGPTWQGLRVGAWAELFS